MRLTLRTLIAFRDQVLSEDQQNQLTDRIKNNELARTLLTRIEESSQCGVGDELLALDANVTSNYLDSSLTDLATQQYEEVAITNSDLLSEVADCHRMLASYGERLADNTKEDVHFRNRLYSVSPTVNSPVDEARESDLSAFAISVESEEPIGWLSFRGLFGPVTSAVVNGVMLIVLSLLTVGAAHKTRPITLSITEGEPAGEVSIRLPKDLDLEVETKNFADLMDESIEVRNEAPQLDDHFFEEANNSTLAASTTTDFSQFLASTNGGALSSKTSGKPSIRYYGQEYSARDVVYVVDASGSMQGARFRRACEELIYSLNHLDTTQSFAVLFFSGNRVRAFPYGKQLFKANRRNIQKAQRFIALTNPHGGTEPSNSIVNALRRDPELIFFLSDGEIPNATLDDTKNANVDLTVINTIGFANRYGARLLRALAEQNGGKYRFVP